MSGSKLTSEVLVQHAAFVRARLRRLGVPADAIDDATQDVFEVLVRRIDDYDAERSLPAWLAGIARRVAARHRERPRFPPEQPLREGEPSPEERAARAQAWRLLEHFVGELEPERWSVFVLSELEGLPASQIARELGQNPSTVSSRLRSARASFERMLQRHHARERRSFMLAPQLASPGSATWALGGLSVGLLFTIGAARCWVGESDERPAVSGASEPERVDLQRASVAVLDARHSDPASARATAGAPGEDGWLPAGHGFATLAGGTFSHEQRYRLDDSKLTFEVTYLADDDSTTSVHGQIELDGLEPIAGGLEWQESIPAGQTRVWRLHANASREGVVGLRLRHTHPAAGDGSIELRWMHAGGVLRRCVEHECEPPAVERELLSGSTIEVELVNSCSTRVEFVLVGGPSDRQPPEHLPVHSLEPDEHRRATLDVAQWIRRRDADGRVGGGVRTDSPGSVIRFFETTDADDCDGLSTTDPPPA